MARALPFVIVQLLASAASATRFATNFAQETPFVPGYYQNEVPIPKPTTPPQVIRHLLPRDAATCGWMISDGSPNVCGSSQYCMTTASSGGFGIWNCCNPDSCFTQTACSSGVECGGDSPYCVTSFMSNSGTTYSRFMCGTTSSLVYMAYESEDTPQFTQSLLSNSLASAASASSASASAASASAASASAASAAAGKVKSTTDAASKTGASHTGSNRATHTSDSGGGGVSGGTIAGAVVGAVAGIALLAGLAFFFWRRSQKNKAGKLPPEMASNGPDAYHGEYKPYPPSEVYAHTGASNGSGYAPVPQQPSELPVEHQTYELGGDIPTKNHQATASELGPMSPKDAPEHHST